MSNSRACEHAVILAGGASRRMGSNKALVQFDGLPLVRRVADVLRSVFPHVIIATTDEDVTAAAGLDSISDTPGLHGPLAGIHSALAYLDEPVLAVACDMPHLNADFLRFMVARYRPETEALLPRVGGFIEPMHAIYAPRSAEKLIAGAGAGRRLSLRETVAQLDAEFVEEDEIARFDPNFKMFVNWNTPADIEAAQL